MDHLCEHRRCRYANDTALTAESGLTDLSVLQFDIKAKDITTHWIVGFLRDIRIFENTFIPRLTIMVQDLLTIWI